MRPDATPAREGREQDTMTTSTYRSIFHRDGTVTLWHVYRQQWVRLAADAISDETLATLSQRERVRILRMREAR